MKKLLFIAAILTTFSTSCVAEEDGDRPINQLEKPEPDNGSAETTSEQKPETTDEKK